MTATGWESNPLTASAQGVHCDDPSGETTLSTITAEGNAPVCRWSEYNR